MVILQPNDEDYGGAIRTRLMELGVEVAYWSKRQGWKEKQGANLLRLVEAVKASVTGAQLFDIFSQAFSVGESFGDPMKSPRGREIRD